jgi:hypothetical protein
LSHELPLTAKRAIMCDNLLELLLFEPCTGHASFFGLFEFRAVGHLRISRASRTLSLEDRVSCSKALVVYVYVCVCVCVCMCIHVYMHSGGIVIFCFHNRRRYDGCTRAAESSFTVIVLCSTRAAASSFTIIVLYSTSIATWHLQD